MPVCVSKINGTIVATGTIHIAAVGYSRKCQVVLPARLRQPALARHPSCIALARSSHASALALSQAAKNAILSFLLLEPQFNPLHRCMKKGCTCGESFVLRVCSLRKWAF